jgi:hypothetical protein
MSTGPRPADRLDWEIASITAHRDLAPSDAAVIQGAMQTLVAHPSVDAIYFGGARGGDTIALQAALYFRQGQRPWLTVVVPDRVEKQPVETHFWTRKADEVIELRNEITKADYFQSFTIRDRYLVDVATYLVAFFNDNYKTGTGKTVRMAEKDGLQVHKIKVVGG